MNRIRIFSAALPAFLVLSALAFGGVHRWTSHGPDGDESFLALAIDPVTPTTLYASSPPHGLFQSTDGGESWLRVGDRNLYQLIVDPRVPSTLFGIPPSPDGLV